MQMADEFYLIAHDDSSGQLRLHPKVAGCGVAAALLAELIMLERVYVEAGVLKSVSTLPPPDALARTIFGQVLGELTPLPVRDWLTFLGRTAVDDVAQRLVRIEVLERVESRMSLFGGKKRYTTLRVNDAAWPAARITSRLIRRDPMEPSDQVLAALVQGTGLSAQMLWDDQTGVSRRYLRSVVAALPESLRVLVAEVEFAVSKVAITRS
jgi:hypothetical protein